jgi:NADPH-dependent curcumin reductase CurA
VRQAASIQNLQWIYRKQPIEVVGPEHYERIETQLATDLTEGQVLVAAKFISVDPYMRINQSSKATWASPHPLHTVQSAGAVSQVIASNSPAYAVGDWLFAQSGWQTHAKLHVSETTKIDPRIATPSAWLGAMGMPGRTAWFGLTEAGRPKAGEVVVVSGAAGAVGSLVVQFAKRHGCVVIGIAGGVAKCSFVTQTLGADFALDYKSHSSAATLSEAIVKAAGGVDVYFDNVGGMVTDAIIPIINRRARIIICGQISQYSGGLDAPPVGPRLLHHMLYQRATIQGILARDYLHRVDEMHGIVGPWVKSGKIKMHETLIDGFDQLPSALNQLFTGDHTGKLVVKISGAVGEPL